MQPAKCLKWFLRTFEPSDNITGGVEKYSLIENVLRIQNNNGRKTNLVTFVHSVAICTVLFDSCHEQCLKKVQPKVLAS